MKKLLTWFVAFVLLMAALVWFLSWKEDRERSQRARQQQEQRERDQEAILRQQALAAPPDAPAPMLPRNSPGSSRQLETLFRQLAERHRVEVLEYRGITANEVVVTLRTRNQTGIGDLMDEAIREQIMLDFDDRMQRENDQMSVDPNGAYIWQTRFTFRAGAPNR